MFISLARVSHMYYEKGMTQQEIAKRLNLPRMKVSRMLQQARDEGVVTTVIRYGGFYPDLEDALAEKYPRTSFIVSEALDGEPASIIQSVSATAANFFEQEVREGQTVAVGWGTTLRALEKTLNAIPRNVQFVPVIGGQVHRGLDVHANSIAEAMANHTDTPAMRIFAPAVVASKDERNQLMQTTSVKETIQAAVNADIALFSVGSPFSPSNTIERVGYYSPTDIEELRRQNAVCDVISMAYFNPEGREVCQQITQRTVGITYQQLRSIPRKICVAGGTGKHEAVLVALKLGLADVLVVDEFTANYLLDTSR